MGAMKHFPGGGCVFEDTHSESPTCEMDRAELLASHVMPFATAIEAGADIVGVYNKDLPENNSHDALLALEEYVVASKN